MKVAQINGRRFAFLDSPFGPGGTVAMPTFEDLTDVDMTGIADGEVPVWDSGTSTWLPGSGGGSGTVTSVALTVPAELSVAGSPITTFGTLAVTKANQSANTVWAGPTSGAAAAPAFRALVAADIPSGIGYHEVVMVTSSSPPDPVLNSAGDDWCYSS